MRPVVTHGVVWYVSRSVVIVNNAKTAKPIEMPFGSWTLVGRGNHVLDGVEIPHGKGQGHDGPLQSIGTTVHVRQ